MLLSTGRRAVDQYLLSTGPTAAELPEWCAAAEWDGWTGRQTDGRLIVS